MSYRVAALYQFLSLPDAAELRASLETLCAGLGITGTILLAREGVNGTVAGSTEAIDALLAGLHDLFGDRLDRLELKFSEARTQPFQRLKIRLKREIVTFDGGRTDPNAVVGTYVEPAAWNALIAEPDITLIDTRNRFEVAMGSFAGATDPGLDHFSDFVAYAENLDPSRPVAMFCTGGIRCEKASAYLLSRGFSRVYHLKGGILAYLEQVPEIESRWTGECFVFDERIALRHGLKPKANPT